jgi:hypothetical protein
MAANGKTELMVTAISPFIMGLSFFCMTTQQIALRVEKDLQALAVTGRLRGREAGLPRPVPQSRRSGVELERAARGHPGLGRVSVLGACLTNL